MVVSERKDEDGGGVEEHILLERRKSEANE
jgi:hypothetical protein